MSLRDNRIHVFDIIREGRKKGTSTLLPRRRKEERRRCHMENGKVGGRFDDRYEQRRKRGGEIQRETVIAARAEREEGRGKKRGWERARARAKRGRGGRRWKGGSGERVDGPAGQSCCGGNRGRVVRFSRSHPPDVMLPNNPRRASSPFDIWTS